MRKLALVNSFYCFTLSLQSLWVTTWCSSDLQHTTKQTILCKKPQNITTLPTASESSEKLLQSPTSETEMSDMLLQCNKNAIYVLNTSYHYGDVDMINLFGSPAGRALNTKSLPVQEQSYNNSANHLSSVNNIATNYKTNDDNGLFSENHLIYGLNNSNNVNRSTKRNSILKTNLFTKKVKFWKLLENENNKRNSLEDISTASSSHSSSSMWWRNHRKSSSELYREAAQLLGLSCTLSDNCRCLDCQSGYFDCDDSDTCSDQSCIADFGMNLSTTNNNNISIKYSNSTEGLNQDNVPDKISNCESLSDLSSDDIECVQMATT